MGLFDTVKFEMNCPLCGNLIKDFQTKTFDYPSLEEYTVQKVVEDSPRKVVEFHTSCDKCLKNHKLVWISIEISDSK